MTTATRQRVYGSESKGIRPSLQHNVLHLAKYAGEFAMIAEDADHEDPEKRARARRRALEWLTGDRRQDFEDQYRMVIQDLTELAVQAARGDAQELAAGGFTE